MCMKTHCKNGIAVIKYTRVGRIMEGVGKEAIRNWYWGSCCRIKRPGRLVQNDILGVGG